VFGGLPRLQAHGRIRDGIMAGVGLALEILSRPFESLLLALCMAPMIRKRAWIVGLAALPALLLTAVQDKAVTQSFFSLPYMLSRYEYGVPTTFTFQSNPAPHRELTREQQLDYQAQTDVHGDRPESPARYFERLGSRIRFYRFFLLPALYPALLFCLPSFRTLRYMWAGGSLLVFALGTNFYPYFYPHYVAAAGCLLILFAVTGLARLNELRLRGFAAGREAAQILLLLGFAHFGFWYGIHLLGDENLFIATGPYESFDFINFGDSERRQSFNRELDASSGEQLVFVRLGPTHLLREWIHNEADIDRAHVVWALDLGQEEDQRLIAYYPRRTVWLAEPDAKPPRLSRFPSGRAQ
jgi:hypothetical protein